MPSTSFERVSTTNHSEFAINQQLPYMLCRKEELVKKLILKTFGSLSQRTEVSGFSSKNFLHWKLLGVVLNVQKDMN